LEHHHHHHHHHHRTAFGQERPLPGKARPLARKGLWELMWMDGVGAPSPSPSPSHGLWPGKASARKSTASRQEMPLARKRPLARKCLCQVWYIIGSNFGSWLNFLVE